MNIIFFLIGCSIFLALIFLGAFFWATKTGQNDDTYTPSVRILFDDDTIDHKEPSPSTAAATPQEKLSSAGNPAALSDTTKINTLALKKNRGLSL